MNLPRTPAFGPDCTGQIASRRFNFRASRRAALRRAVWAAPCATFETLEARTLLSVTTLNNGTGDGSLTVILDPYGAYGSAAAPAGTALYDPVGALGPTSTTFQSGLFFSPFGDFLSEGGVVGRTNGTGLPTINFTSTTGTQAISAFDVAGFHVDLTQSLSSASVNGSSLTQTYVFTNNSGIAQNFNVVRHVDGDLFFGGDFTNDFGGATFNGRSVFEFDTASDPTQSTGFFSINDSGDGTFDSYTVQHFPYLQTIAGAGGIPAADKNVINGDANGDHITDAGYDVTVSQQDDFQVAVGQSVSYTTTTFFGQGAPADLLAAGRFAFTAASADVGESAGAITLTVNRGGGTSGNVTVAFNTVGQTATAGADFTPVSGILNFADGQTTATITVPIINDTLEEPTESFNVVLSNPTNGASLGSPASELVNIIDDDAPGIFVFSAPTYSFAENAGVATVEVDRVQGSASFASVNYATTDGTAKAGADYTATTGQLNFGPGQTSAFFTVPLIDDTAIEGNEFFTVNLADPTSGASIRLQPRTTNVVIVDNDSTIQFAQSSTAPTFLGNAGTVDFNVTRTGVLTSPATVEYTTVDGSAKGGIDFTPITGVAVFQPGQASVVVSVALLFPDAAQPYKTFSLFLSTPQGDGVILGTQTVSTITIAEPPTVTDVKLFGTDKKISAIVLNFDEPLFEQQVTSDYLLYSRSNESSNGAAKRKALPVSNVIYDGNTDTVTIVPKKALTVNQMYQVTVNGAGGVMNVQGLLASDGTTGNPSTGFSAYFARGNKISWIDHDGDQANLKLKGPGVFDVIRKSNGDAKAVRLIDALPGETVLSGTVSRKQKFDDGIITIDVLSGTNNIGIQLSSPPFTIKSTLP